MHRLQSKYNKKSVTSYFPSSLITMMREKVLKANKLAGKGNKSMTEAIEDFIEAIEDELVPSGRTEEKTTSSTKEDVEPIESEDPLYDTREEALEAIGLPTEADSLSKLKKGKDIVSVLYKDMNKEEVAFLDLPESQKECDDKYTKTQLVEFLLTGETK